MYSSYNYFIKYLYISINTIVSNDNIIQKNNIEKYNTKLLGNDMPIVLMEKDWCIVVHQLDNIFQNGILIRNKIINIFLFFPLKLFNNI